MKTLYLTFSLFVATLLVLVGCDDGGTALVGDHAADAPHAAEEAHFKSNVFDGRDSVAWDVNGLQATQANFSIVTEFVVIDKAGEFVGIDDVVERDPSMPLFEGRANNPILAPDDHHVTWGEFSSAEGAVIVKCTEKETHTVSHLAGLIPNGLYSVWLKVFEDGALIPIADEEGKNNLFRASTHGEGHIAGSIRAGSADSIGDCMLEDVDDGAHMQLVAIYHIDGEPGVDEGTYVEQTGFTFVEPEEDDGDDDEFIVD